MVAAILRLRPGVPPPPFVRVVARAGNLVTARFRRSALESVRRCVDAVLHPLARRVPPRLVRGHGERGVVGVIEGGCNLDDPEVRVLWDQRGRGRAPLGYGYGVVHGPGAIRDALDDDDPFDALDYDPSPPSSSRGQIFVDVGTGDTSALRVIEAIDFVVRTAGGRPWSLALGFRAPIIDEALAAIVRDGTGRSLAEGEDAAPNRRGTRIAFYDEDSLRFIEGWTRAKGASSVILINRSVFNPIREDGRKRARAFDKYLGQAFANRGADLQAPPFRFEVGLHTAPINPRSAGDWDDTMVDALIAAGRPVSIQSERDQWAEIERIFKAARDDAAKAAAAGRDPVEFVDYFVLDLGTATLTLVAATGVTMQGGHATVPLGQVRGTKHKVVPKTDANMRVIGDIHTHYLLDPLIDTTSASLGHKSGARRTMHAGVSPTDVASAKDDHLVVYAVDSKYLHRARPDGTKDDKLPRRGNVLREALRVFGREPS